MTGGETSGLCAWLVRRLPTGLIGGVVCWLLTGLSAGI